MAQKKSSQSNNGRGCLRGCLTLIVVVIVLGFGISSFVSQDWNRSDETVLKDYQASSETTDLAERTGMNDKGKAALYRGEPTFLQGEAFKKKCLSKGFQGELAGGCMLAGPMTGPLGLPVAKTRIYILKIDDPEFVDNKYTTAAHEMLHIIYKRLDSKDRKRVDDLIEKEIVKRPDDKQITARVNAMKRLKKNYQDELHSQFGTVYRDLLPELEEHYKEYFMDREKVLAIADRDGLTKRMRRQDELSQELAELNGSLTTMQGQLNSYKNSGDEASYNNNVSQFNGMVSQYNAGAAEIRKINSEMIQFYKYIDPDYQPPQNAQ